MDGAAHAKYQGFANYLPQSSSKKDGNVELLNSAPGKGRGNASFSDFPPSLSQYPPPFPPPPLGKFASGGTWDWRADTKNKQANEETPPLLLWKNKEEKKISSILSFWESIVQSPS